MSFLIQFNMTNFTNQQVWRSSRWATWLCTAMLFVVGMAGAEARAVTSAASAVTVAEAANPTISPTDVVRGGPNSGIAVGVPQGRGEPSTLKEAAPMMTLVIDDMTINVCEGDMVSFTVSGLPTNEIPGGDDVELNFSNFTTSQSLSVTVPDAIDGTGEFLFMTNWTPLLGNDGDFIQLNVSFRDEDNSGGAFTALPVSAALVELNVTALPDAAASAVDGTVCSDVNVVLNVTNPDGDGTHFNWTATPTGATGNTSATNVAFGAGAITEAYNNENSVDGSVGPLCVLALMARSVRSSNASSCRSVGVSMKASHWWTLG